MNKYDELKEQLISRLKQIRSTSEDIESNIQDDISELSVVDNHPADIGTELFEKEKDKALNDRAEEELLNIKQALIRMQNGTYGTCSICGAEIPKQRLEAIPWTDRCIDHVQTDENNLKYDDFEQIDDLDIDLLYEENDPWLDVNEKVWRDFEKSIKDNNPSFFDDDESQW